MLGEIYREEAVFVLLYCLRPFSASIWITSGLKMDKAFPNFVLLAEFMENNLKNGLEAVQWNKICMRFPTKAYSMLDNPGRFGKQWVYYEYYVRLKKKYQKATALKDLVLMKGVQIIWPFFVVFCESSPVLYRLLFNKFISYLIRFPTRSYVIAFGVHFYIIIRLMMNKLVWSVGNINSCIMKKKWLIS